MIQNWKLKIRNFLPDRGQCLVGSLTGAVALTLKSFSVKDFNGAFLGKPKKQIGYMLEPLVKTCELKICHSVLDTESTVTFIISISIKFYFKIYLIKWIPAFAGMTEESKIYE